MNISIERLAMAIRVFEKTKESSFEGAIRHRRSIHAIKLISIMAITSPAEDKLINGAVGRAQHFIDRFVDKEDKP